MIFHDNEYVSVYLNNWSGQALRGILNIKQYKWYLGSTFEIHEYFALNYIYWSWPSSQQNGHSERTETPEVKHSPDHTAASLSTASSGLKNDHLSPGGATTPAAIVKRETEHSQSAETPGVRQEASGNFSVI